MTDEARIDGITVSTLRHPATIICVHTRLRGAALSVDLLEPLRSVAALEACLLRPGARLIGIELPSSTFIEARAVGPECVIWAVRSACVAEQLVGKRRYKGESKQRQTAGMRSVRREMLETLRSGRCGVTLELGDVLAAYLLDDAAGHALGALLCAIRVAQAVKRDVVERVPGAPRLEKRYPQRLRAFSSSVEPIQIQAP